ncbi:MAG TPA: succinate dehydrogenase assembly factor 2 [Alphaproteobacteria bacterium]|jgi:antitoxin CptB
MSDADPHEIRRKRLLFLSQHRGMKEADILIGSFAARHLPAMTAEQLDRFERLLDEEDADLMDWLMGKQPIPDDVESDVFTLLQQFKLY